MSRDALVEALKVHSDEVIEARWKDGPHLAFIVIAILDSEESDDGYAACIGEIQRVFPTPGCSFKAGDLIQVTVEDPPVSLSLPDGSVFWKKSEGL